MLVCESAQPSICLCASACVDILIYTHMHCFYVRRGRFVCVISQNDSVLTRRSLEGIRNKCSTNTSTRVKKSFGALDLASSLEENPTNTKKMRFFLCLYSSNLY